MFLLYWQPTANFLKACPKLDHMAHFGFHINRFKCFKGGSNVFATKTSNQRHCTNGITFGILCNADTKIALCTYPKLTLNGNFVGCPKIRVLREYSIARGYRQSHQSRCWRNNKAQITWMSKKMLETRTKHLRGFMWRKMLIIGCKTWH